MSGNGRPKGVRGRNLAVAAVGYAGLAMSITLLFLGMRLVMEVGGSCGEGGPYEWAVPRCPDAAVPATLLGIFGFLVFGAIAMGGGAAVGGVWSRTGSFAWFALFAVLGWNFLDYGLFNPPAGSGPEPGLVICGVLFWIMAIAPLVAPILLGPVGLALGGPRTAAEGLKAEDLPGPGQPAQGEGAPASEAPTAEAGDTFTEGTQALLDRLERLADMRDRGLLDADEFEAAKAAITRELEARS